MNLGQRVPLGSSFSTSSGREPLASLRISGRGFHGSDALPSTEVPSVSKHQVDHIALILTSDLASSFFRPSTRLLTEWAWLPLRGRQQQYIKHWKSNEYIKAHYHTTTTVLQPFFRVHPGEPVPEENFWTLWCKGRLTEAYTPTIQLGATPSGLTSAHLHHSPIFYRPDALPADQPTVSKH